MSDSDFVDIPSHLSSPCIPSPTISISSDSVTTAQINDVDERVATDQMPAPIHDFGASLDPNHPRPDENYDGAGVASTSLTDRGLVQSMLELSSFLPIIQSLRSTLRLDALSPFDYHYYFRGVPSDEEIQELESLVHRIDAFNLTKSSHEHIPIGMMLRVLSIRRWSGSFFPVLKTLRVTDADSDTMSLLDLFYSPLLEFFELTDLDSWSSTCINNIHNFLHNLPQESSNLSVLKILLNGSTLDVDIRFLDFVHLRQLHLRNVAINDWELLHDLSELSSLQILDLKLTVPQSYKRRFTPENRGISDWNTIVDSPERGDPTGFRALSILRVSAVIEVLDDLIGMVAANNLQELDMALLAYCNPPPPRKNRKAFLRDKTHFTPVNEDDYFFSLFSRMLRQCPAVKRTFIGLLHESADIAQPQRDHFIPSTALEELLRADIEHLTIGGWNFNYNIPTVIEAVGRNTYFRSLSFPAGRWAYAWPQGFPLSTLSSIAHIFPNLVLFQGYVSRDISDIPDFLPDGPIPLTNKPSHPLRSLCLGDGKLSWTSEDKYYNLRVAFYLDNLFANLQNIIAGEGTDGDDWRFIERAVKMCQACRAS